jgi:predicted site-specific integrase-resolvase
MERANALTKFFEDLKADLISTLKSEVSQLNTKSASGRVATSEYCRQNSITRHTLYRWRKRGLIQVEKIGGKHYVILDSGDRKKYQRELA